MNSSVLACFYRPRPQSGKRSFPTTIRPPTVASDLPRKVELIYARMSVTMH